MPQNVAGPLADKDYESINKRLADLQRLREDLQKAHSAGIDCTERQGYCDFLQQQLEALKRQYFPSRP